MSRLIDSTSRQRGSSLARTHARVHTHPHASTCTHLPFSFHHTRLSRPLVVHICVLVKSCFRVGWWVERVNVAHSQCQPIHTLTPQTLTRTPPPYAIHPPTSHILPPALTSTARRHQSSEARARRERVACAISCLKHSPTLPPTHPPTHGRTFTLIDDASDPREGRHAVGGGPVPPQDDLLRGVPNCASQVPVHATDLPSKHLPIWHSLPLAARPREGGPPAPIPLPLLGVFFARHCAVRASLCAQL
jgi:hypothetical protein